MTCCFWHPGHVAMTTPRSNAMRLMVLTERVSHTAHVNTMTMSAWTGAAAYRVRLETKNAPHRLMRPVTLPSSPLPSPGFLGCASSFVVASTAPESLLKGATRHGGREGCTEAPWAPRQAAPETLETPLDLPQLAQALDVQVHLMRGRNSSPQLLAIGRAWKSHPAASRRGPASVPIASSATLARSRRRRADMATLSHPVRVSVAARVWDAASAITLDPDTV